MPNRIPNLWPAETAAVETLSPLAILRTQAENLTQMTHGLLEGQIISDSVTGGKQEYVFHHFDIVAPALNRYRHRILSVMHSPHLIYPVSFMTEAPEAEELDGLPVTVPQAHTENEFIKSLSGALQSGYVRSVVSSLVAQSNEAQTEKQPASRELQPA